MLPHRGFEPRLGHVGADYFSGVTVVTDEKDPKAFSCVSDCDCEEI